MRLLSSRVTKLLKELLVGDHNPYSKEQELQDGRLKTTVEKYYQKMVRMEKKKYSRPFMSESLEEIAKMLGCVKKS